MKRTILVASVLIMTLMGCTPKIPVTSGLLMRMKSQSIDPLKLQYYNDLDIVMHRQITTGETKAEKGVIKYEGDKQIEYITIKANTPGVCVDNSDPAYMLIKFDNCEDCALWFSKNENNVYTMGADKFYNNYKSAVVKYGGKTYNITNAPAWATLKVKKDSHMKVKETSHVAKGVKVN